MNTNRVSRCYVTALHSYWFSHTSPHITLSPTITNLAKSYLDSKLVRMSSIRSTIRARVLSSQGVTAVVHGCYFMQWAHWKGEVRDCNAGWGVGMVGSSLAPIPLQ